MCQLSGIGAALEQKWAESDRSLMTPVCAGSLLTAWARQHGLKKGANTSAALSSVCRNISLCSHINCTARNVSPDIHCHSLRAMSRPWEGSRKLRFPDFMTMAHEGGKVVSLTHRLHLPPGNSPGTHFCQRLSRPQGHSAIGRIMSMKNYKDTIWNRTSDLPICSTAT